jgi:hypothetical protein
MSERRCAPMLPDVDTERLLRAVNDVTLPPNAGR